jgi:putative hydrolase of the HAD superfamily
MTKPIKHVFFDLDHTLWDFDKNSAITFERIFNLHKVELDINAFIEVYEPINLKYWKLYREEKITKPQLRYARLREAFDMIGFDTHDQLINELSVAYIEHLTTINHLFDGALAILEYLKKTYKLHIITNGFEEAQERKLINSKIKSYFTTVTNSEMVGVKKPNPQIFNFALEAAKAIPHESLMIGDSLEADIQGAENVGMKTIWFDNRNESNNYLKLKINHLNELKQLL